MSLENQENNQTFIEKIDADILKELESIQKTHNLLVFNDRENDKKNNKQNRAFSFWISDKWAESRKQVFREFCKEMQFTFGNKEINDLMMEVLESNNVELIKDRCMILYNIALSNDLDKEYDFKEREFDEDLIEDNIRRAKNRQWYKDKVQLINKFLKKRLGLFFIILSIITFIFYCNLFKLAGAVTIIWGIIYSISKIESWDQNNYIEEDIKSKNNYYNNQNNNTVNNGDIIGKNKNSFFNSDEMREVNELSKKEMERESRRIDNQMGAERIIEEERQESLRKALLESESELCSNSNNDLFRYLTEKNKRDMIKRYLNKHKY